jgi:ribosomal protein S10
LKTTHSNHASNSGDKTMPTKVQIRFYITKSKAGHYHGSAWEQRNGKNFQRLVQTTIKHPTKEHAAFELVQLLNKKGFSADFQK